MEVKYIMRKLTVVFLVLLTSNAYSQIHLLVDANNTVVCASADAFPPTTGCSDVTVSNAQYEKTRPTGLHDGESRFLWKLDGTGRGLVRQDPTPTMARPFADELLSNQAMRAEPLLMRAVALKAWQDDATLSAAMDRSAELSDVLAKIQRVRQRCAEIKSAVSESATPVTTQ